MPNSTSIHSMLRCNFILEVTIYSLIMLLPVPSVTYPWIWLGRTRGLKTRTVDCEVVVGDVVNFKCVMVWGRSLVVWHLTIWAEGQLAAASIIENPPSPTSGAARTSSAVLSTHRAITSITTLRANARLFFQRPAWEWQKVVNRRKPLARFYWRQARVINSWVPGQVRRAAFAFRRPKVLLEPISWSVKQNRTFEHTCSLWVTYLKLIVL